MMALQRGFQSRRHGFNSRPRHLASKVSTSLGQRRTAPSVFDWAECVPYMDSDDDGVVAVSSVE